MSDADQSKPPMTPAQERQATRKASLLEKEKKLQEQLDQVKRKQLELARVTEGKEASRKRQCLLVGQQLLLRARTDPGIASLVLSLIEELPKKGQEALGSIKAQMENLKSGSPDTSMESGKKPKQV